MPFHTRLSGLITSLRVVLLTVWLHGLVFFRQMHGLPSMPFSFVWGDVRRNCLQIWMGWFLAAAPVLLWTHIHYCCILYWYCFRRQMKMCVCVCVAKDSKVSPPLCPVKISDRYDYEWFVTSDLRSVHNWISVVICVLVRVSASENNALVSGFLH